MKPAPGMPPAAITRVVTTALTTVGLGDLALDTPTSALSGGQTQRLALAGTLALDPSVVLLDEPTAMLDPESAQEVRDAVAALTSCSGAPTVVVVEHVLGPWVDLVERLVVLSDDGRVVADGPVRATLEAERERLLAMGVRRGRARPSRWPSTPRSSHRGPLAPPRPSWPLLLVVERTTRLLDGGRRTRRAAELTAGLEAAPGSLTALVGPSGSGKSTVLHAPSPGSSPPRHRMPCASPRRMPARPPLPVNWTRPTWRERLPGCRRSSPDDRRGDGARRGAGHLPSPA